VIISRPERGYHQVMRALLVVNPKATATTARTRDVLAHALASDLKVDVIETQRRGHAAELARQAAEDRLDLVITLGGDGTVNEAVNGLLHAGPGPDVPTLAIVPGGSTNVIARALGLPRDPVEATGALLELLRAGQRRTIGLGRADERYFTFNAGLGIDGEVVRRAEHSRGRGRRATNRLYVMTAMRVIAEADRSSPPLTLSRPGADDVTGLHLAFVQNVAPWTYLRGRRLDACPDASFDTGLDLYALRRLRWSTALRQVRQLATGGPRRRTGKAVLGLHDLSELTLRAERPLALQLDGDDMGDRTEVRFAAVPDALVVVA
jgi:diacylglycerol kinase family enzyme